MENKEMKKPIPVELNDEMLDADDPSDIFR